MTLLCNRPTGHEGPCARDPAREKGGILLPDCGRALGDFYFFGCWNEAGHYLHGPRGVKAWGPGHDHLEYYASPAGERRHLDATLAPRKVNNTGAIIFDGMMPKDVSHRHSNECPQGQFLRHVLRNGFTAISWWDRTQGDRRGACNSTVLARGERTSAEMLAILVEHFPSVLENLKQAGIELVEVQVTP